MSAISFLFVDRDEFNRLMDRLRLHGGDLPEVEVKSAAGGFPESILPTLSAFANRPGGGVIILGVDERDDFTVVGLSNPAGLSAALASKARLAFDPPVSIDISTIAEIGVLVAVVGETARSHKPCRLVSTGAAYMRFGDGDFRMSDLEIDGFIVNRDQPRFDQQPVPGATRSDLDPGLVAAYCATAREASRTLGRLDDDELLLVKTGVLASDAQPTAAGVLALADYPQQWFPNFVIQAGAVDEDTQNPAVRFSDTARFDGPVPTMIDDALDWARRQRSRRIVELPDGTVRNVADIPDVVLRELIANAVVHRDLAPWSWSRAIELRFTPERFIIANPGGLYGVSVDRLGFDQLTSARNLSLVRICQYIRLRDRTVIEAMASGIPRVRQALNAEGMPAPEFHDQGIRFTALIQRRPTHRTIEPAVDPTVERTARSTATTPSQERILALLDAGSARAVDLAESLGISVQAVRRTLSALIDAGLVERRGRAYRHSASTLEPAVSNPPID